MAEILYAQRTVEVDNRMNITVHGRAGVALSLRFPGRDVSAATMFVEVQGLFRRALGPGATNEHRTLTLTQADVAAIHAADSVNHARAYIVTDESGAVPDNLWDAQIKVIGWTGAPPP